METKLHVSNVKCDGCVQRIKSGLLAMAGITHVEVDIPTGLVTISGDKLPQEGITATLTGLGYPPTGAK